MKRLQYESNLLITAVYISLLCGSWFISTETCSRCQGYHTHHTDTDRCGWLTAQTRDTFIRTSPYPAMYLIRYMAHHILFSNVKGVFNRVPLHNCVMHVLALPWWSPPRLQDRDNKCAPIYFHVFMDIKFMNTVLLMAENCSLPYIHCVIPKTLSVI